MNRGMMIYCLGNLAQANDLSPQCQTVRTILLARGNDRERISKLLRLLDGSESLENDTTSCLVRGIRGHYGLEGFILDISFQEEAQFWMTLHHRFPSNPQICLVTADALFLAEGPTEQALDMFFTAFEMDPDRWVSIDGEVSAIMLDSTTYRLRYQLQLLKWTIAEGIAEYVEELVEELRFEYAESVQVLDEINHILRRDTGN